eukprot:s467_g26.t1
MIYSSSKTQKVVSLSSAESETYAAAGAVMDAVLIHGIFTWLLGLHIIMCLHLDSSASRGILSRKGVGRLRHLSCRVLWLQDLVSERSLMVRSVLGTLNPADVGTKRLSAARLQSLSFLLGLYSTSSGTLVGSNDPGGIFQQSPAKQQQIRLLLSALGLATMTQLQGCEHADNMAFYNLTGPNSRAMESIAADGQFEVRCVLTWLLMLVGYGAYMVMTLGNSKVSLGHDAGDADGFEGADGSDGMTEYSLESEPENGEPEWEPPAFSPEGLLNWLYRRCSGREERSAANGDAVRLERYRQRKIALQDMLSFLHHCTPIEYQRAHEMLHTISDLSDDETSPVENADEGIDLGPAAAASVAAAMTLQGCDGDGFTPPMSFQTGVLLGWTLLCCVYTWWMLRIGTWQSMPVMGAPMPSIMQIPEGPKAEDVPTPQAEGWVTLTCLRILQRLQRAERQHNVGRSLKYQQWRRWMMSFLVHLPGTTGERERMVETLRDEHALSDDGDSPLHGLPEDARDMLIVSSARVHTHLCGLLENVTLEEAISLLQLFAEAFKPQDPPAADDGNDDDDDDDSMGVSETESHKRARYLRDPMCECSDPEYWMLLNHGPAEADSDDAQEY